MAQHLSRQWRLAAEQNVYGAEVIVAIIGRLQKAAHLCGASMGAGLLCVAGFGSAAQHVVSPANVNYDAEQHVLLHYEVECDEATIVLSGAGRGPFICSQPDSTVPVAVMDGPNPFSQPVALFAAIDTCDVTIVVEGVDGATVASGDFKSLAPGPYFVKVVASGLRVGIYSVRLEYAGRPVGTMRLANVRGRNEP